MIPKKKKKTKRSSERAYADRLWSQLIKARDGMCRRCGSRSNALERINDRVAKRAKYKGLPLEAHQWKGYAQEHWLDVKWVCPQCHRDAHGLSIKRLMELPDFFTLAYGDVLSRTMPPGLPAAPTRGKDAYLYTSRGTDA